jgi:HPt (histidine-containing phosphotransfer) domain-containing protein
MIDKLKEYQQIDTNILKEVSCGNNDLISDLLQMFTRQAPIFAEQLESLYACKDFVSLSKLAHKIKGSAATLGICHLVAKMKELENSAKEEDKNNTCRELIELFKTTSQSAIVELNYYLNRQ